MDSERISRLVNEIEAGIPAHLSNEEKLLANELQVRVWSERAQISRFVSEVRLDTELDKKSIKLSKPCWEIVKRNSGQNFEIPAKEISDMSEIEGLEMNEKLLIAICQVAGTVFVMFLESEDETTLKMALAYLVKTE